MWGALKAVLVKNQSMTLLVFCLIRRMWRFPLPPPLISWVHRSYCVRCTENTPFATIRSLSMRWTKNTMRPVKQVLIALSNAICAISYDSLPIGQRRLKSIAVGYMNLWISPPNFHGLEYTYNRIIYSLYSVVSANGFPRNSHRIYCVGFSGSVSLRRYQITSTWWRMLIADCVSDRVYDMVPKPIGLPI